MLIIQFKGLAPHPLFVYKLQGGFMCHSTLTEVLPDIVLLITILTLNCKDKYIFDG